MIAVADGIHNKQKWVPDKRATPSGVETFGSAVVHDKSGALGMDNPAGTKPFFFAYFAS